MKEYDTSIEGLIELTTNSKNEKTIIIGSNSLDEERLKLFVKSTKALLSEEIGQAEATMLILESIDKL